MITNKITSNKLFGFCERWQEMNAERFLRPDLDSSVLGPLSVPGPPGPVPVSVPDKQRVDPVPVVRPGQRGEPGTEWIVGPGPGVGEGGDEDPGPPDGGGVHVHHQAEPVP